MGINQKPYLTEEDKKAQDGYLEEFPKSNESWVRSQTKEYLEAEKALRSGSAEYYKLIRSANKRKQEILDQKNEESKPSLPVKGQEEAAEVLDPETPAVKNIIDTLKQESILSTVVDQTTLSDDNRASIVEQKEIPNIDNLDKKLKEELKDLPEPPPIDDNKELKENNLNKVEPSSINIENKVETLSNSQKEGKTKPIEDNATPQHDITKVEKNNLLPEEHLKEENKLSSEDEKLIKKEYGRILNFDLPSESKEEEKKIYDIKKNLLIEIKNKEKAKEQVAETIKIQKQQPSNSELTSDKLKNLIVEEPPEQQKNISKFTPEEEELVRKEYGKIFNFDIKPVDDEEKQRIDSIKRNLITNIKMDRTNNEEKEKEIENKAVEENKEQPQEYSYNISDLESISNDIQKLVNVFNSGTKTEESSNRPEQSQPSLSDKNMISLTGSLERLNTSINNLIMSLNNTSFNNNGNNSENKTKNIQPSFSVPRETMAVNTGAIEGFRSTIRKPNQAHNSSYMPSVPGFSI